MSDIIWNVNPNNDSMEELLSRMREYATTVLEAKEIEYTLDFGGEAKSKISLQIKSNLYLIFKEAVNNLAKYSECTHAIIKFSQIDKKIHLCVEDNGKGFDLKEISHRGGLYNMQHRADEIGDIYP
ncbi:MAG: hypothetical protein IPN26_02175 [Bacteroidetes bacterium]|nr:hypothetical protein [Bacteroidota bacterium]